MENLISLELARSQVIMALRMWRAPDPRPLEISPWLAMSLMQKAIRRGREELALGAAASLLETSPERLWRRIGVTVCEDIGVAGMQVIAKSLAAMTGKRWRAEAGGEWPITSWLVVTMCRMAKCRAADDLMVVAEYLPSYEPQRAGFAEAPISRLLDIALGDGPIEERALALWYALGTERLRSRFIRVRRGEPKAVFAALETDGWDSPLVQIAQEGFRKTGEPLAPFVALLARAGDLSGSTIEPDVMPPETLIGEVPGWAYDMHTREGKQALRLLLETDAPSARWITACVKSGRARVAGRMLFCIEGGLVNRRLRWELGDRFLRLSNLECRDVPPSDIETGYKLLLADLPLLDEIRQRVVEG